MTDSIKYKKVVIKLGTSTLTGGSKHLDRARMLEIVRVVARLISEGVQVIVVSSGAIATGREYLDYPKLPNDLSSKQMLAAVGQSKLMETWSGLFAIYRIHIGQLLITRADLDDRVRYLNARDTLFAMLEHKVVPIINENDALSTAEIKVGDNDNLSALTAVLAEADCVVLLTDQKGLYTADPRTDKNAVLIKEVEELTPEIFSLAGGSGTSLGTGGMLTKLKAAEIATAAGIDIAICSGERPECIYDVLAGTGEATYFKKSEHPVYARKSWLSSATMISGKLIVDDGAKEALTRKGASLLPKGIVKVQGEFLRAETVAIADTEGRLIARGLTRYSSEEIELILGKKSEDIETILGFTHGDVVIHRDDLALA